MQQPIFITGIGTDVGKTIVSAILVEALQADYWKPVQAGFEEGSDSEFVRSVISNNKTVIHPETYKLTLAASPHIAAREERVLIDLDKIKEDFYKIINIQQSILNTQGSTHSRIEQDKHSPLTAHTLIIEGAGGLMVPLNNNEFVLDLIKKINTKVILVSRNYLGSINHSLLTAKVCKENNIDVAGWIFNDQYLNYENEIIQWSGYPKIASIQFSKTIDKNFIKEQADKFKPKLEQVLTASNY
jgi:dethiobiotin synthetase